MQKIGENMNRKIMILMVAVVATVLPAVAVADVMITGSVGGLGVAAPDAFTIHQGSNYAAAHSNASFTWKSNSVSSTEVIGNMSIGTMSNETIYEINVLDLTFTQTGYMNFSIDLTSAFPNGTVIYISTSPFTFSSNGMITTNGMNGSLPLNQTGTFSLSSPLPVTAGMTGYVAIAVGSGTVSGSFTGTIVFTS